MGTHRTLLLAAVAACAGCAFHSTATHWNGRVGDDGVPIYVKQTTNLGINAAIVLPLLGNTSIDTMLDETTAVIAAAGSDRVRVVETRSENYWHGFPPFTWILTPVITTLTVEYRPSAAEIAAAAAAEEHFQKAVAERNRTNRDHVIPEPRPRQ